LFVSISPLSVAIDRFVMTNSATITAAPSVEGRDGQTNGRTEGRTDRPTDRWSSFAIGECAVVVTL